MKYLKMSNGGPISSPACTASWDLHEVEFFDQNGNQISVPWRNPEGSLGFGDCHVWYTTVCNRPSWNSRYLKKCKCKDKTPFKGTWKVKVLF